jgi:hypothetical protein
MQQRMHKTIALVDFHLRKRTLWNSPSKEGS